MANYNWDTWKIPQRPLYRSHSDVNLHHERSTQQGVRSGNPGVFYDSSGRLFYQNEEPTVHHYGTSSLPRPGPPWRRELRHDDTYTYDNRKTNSDSRTQRSFGTPRSSGRSIITKHYDSYRRAPKMDLRGQPRTEIIPPIVVNGYAPPMKYVKEGSVIIEERIVSHERPWIWPLFLIAALLMFATGILNILFCVDNHIYILLWLPIFLLIFAILGAVHKGIYRGKGGRWRNWSYIVVGSVTTFLIFMCAAFVLLRLDHATIQVTEYGTLQFVDFEKARMVRFSEFPRVNLTSDLATNVWACYSLDWVAIVLVMICMSVLSSTIIVGNNYYNSNHRYRREVDPFCKPMLFNPYGQISLGQAMAFVGMVLKTSAHGNLKIRWQDYWAPAWAAIIPIVAGLAAAMAFKRIGLRYGRTLVIVALLCEAVSFLITLALVVVISIGLHENILSLGPGPISVLQYSQNLLIASVFIFVIMDIVLLINLIYSLALFIKLIFEGCRREDSDEKRYYTEGRTYIERDPNTLERHKTIERDYTRGGREINDGIKVYDRY